MSYLDKDFAPRGECYQFIYLFTAIICKNKDMVIKIFSELNKMHTTTNNFKIRRLLKMRTSHKQTVENIKNDT